MASPDQARGHPSLNVHPLFREAVHFPTTHTCYGMRLVPLTLGHIFLLHDIESPFVGFKKPSTETPLYAAAMICAQSYADALASVRGDLWPKRMLASIVIFNRGVSQFGEAEKLEEYLSFHRRWPEVKPPPGPTRTLHAPPEWRLLRMMEKAGCTRPEALATPILAAVANLCTDEERDGNLQLEAWDPAKPGRIASLWEFAAEQDRIHAEAN